MMFIQQTFDCLLWAECRRQMNKTPSYAALYRTARSMECEYCLQIIPVEARGEGYVRRWQRPLNASDRLHHLITYNELAKGRHSWLRGQHNQRQRKRKWCKVSVCICVRQSKSVWLDDGRENKGQDLRLSA